MPYFGIFKHITTSSIIPICITRNMVLTFSLGWTDISAAAAAAAAALYTP
jgi:hypothetical protein